MLSHLDLTSNSKGVLFLQVKTGQKECCGELDRGNDICKDNEARNSKANEVTFQLTWKIVYYN